MAKTTNVPSRGPPRTSNRTRRAPRNWASALRAYERTPRDKAEDKAGQKRMAPQMKPPSKPMGKPAKGRPAPLTLPRRPAALPRPRRGAPGAPPARPPSLTPRCRRPRRLPSLGRAMGGMPVCPGGKVGKVKKAKPVAGKRSRSPSVCAGRRTAAQGLCRWWAAADADSAAVRQWPADQQQQHRPGRSRREQLGSKPSGAIQRTPRRTPIRLAQANRRRQDPATGGSHAAGAVCARRQDQAHRRHRIGKDDGLIPAQRGEFVMRKSAVKKLGSKVLEQVNKGKLPSSRSR